MVETPANLTSGTARRPFPVVREHERPFWTGGARDELVVQRCRECRRINHPPTLRCRHDHSPELEWAVVSGHGRVEGWSVNEHQWLDGFPAPYVVALVALVEQPSARLLTNLVGIEPNEIHSGMEVQVTFAKLAAPDGEEEVWIPLFEPRAPE